MDKKIVCPCCGEIAFKEEGEYEDGCPMHFISAMLGHHSVRFTAKRYARFSPESASRAVLRVLEAIAV